MRPTLPTPLPKSSNRRASGAASAAKNPQNASSFEKRWPSLSCAILQSGVNASQTHSTQRPRRSSAAKRFVGTSTQFFTVGKGAGIVCATAAALRRPAATSDAAVRVRAVRLSELCSVLEQPNECKRCSGVEHVSQRRQIDHCRRLRAVTAILCFPSALRPLATIAVERRFAGDRPAKTHKNTYSRSLPPPADRPEPTRRARRDDLHGRGHGVPRR